MLSLYEQISNDQKNCSQTKKFSHLGKPMEEKRFYPWSFRNKKQSESHYSRTPNPTTIRRGTRITARLISLRSCGTWLCTIFFPKNMLGWSDITPPMFFCCLTSRIYHDIKHVRYMGEPQLTIWRVEFWHDVLLIGLSIHKTESGAFTYIDSPFNGTNKNFNIIGWQSERITLMPS